MHASQQLIENCFDIALPRLLAGLKTVEAPAMGWCTTMEAVMSKTQSITGKLSDTQLVILSAAAQRTDRSLIPFPKSLTTKGAALNKVVETLCKRKLAEERESNGSHEWRREENGLTLGLFISARGLRALSLDDKDKSNPQSTAASATPQRKTAPKDRGPKTQEPAATKAKSPRKKRA